MRIAVIRDHPFMTAEPVPGAIPTPRLAQAGGGKAYYLANTDGRSTVPGVWYLHEPGYESPDGRYTRVRVVQIDDGDAA